VEEIISGRRSKQQAKECEGELKECFLSSEYSWASQTLRAPGEKEKISEITAIYIDVF
jgi:hypothetical protein